MPSTSNKIALFIDGANLYATAKTLGFDIDYKRLLREFQSRGNLIRAFYYTAIIEDQEYSSIRPLIDWLDYNGYTVVTKATKEFVDQTGRRKVKGNMDIELAVDAMELAEHVDQIVLFSGDGDFRSLVEAVQRRGVRVTVISTIASQPPMIADELRRQADVFTDLVELQSKLGRDPAERPAAREPVSRATRRSSCTGAPAPLRPGAMRKISKTDAPPARRARATGPAAAPATALPVTADAAEPDRDCRLCPRLAELPRFGPGAGTVVVQRPGSLVWRPPGVAADGRSGAGAAGRQPHRPPVHRGLCRRAALRHTDGIRLRQAGTTRRDRMTACNWSIAGSATRCAACRRRTSRCPLEIRTCRQFLAATLADMPRLRAVVMLGRIAHDSTLKALACAPRDAPFGHGRVASGRRGQAVRQLSLLALQHQHRAC